MEALAQLVVLDAAEDVEDHADVAGGDHDEGEGEEGDRGADDDGGEAGAACAWATELAPLGDEPDAEDGEGDSDEQDDVHVDLRPRV